MDFVDHHSRRLWGSLGVLVGLVVFVAVGVLVGEIGRPMLCDWIG